MYFYLLDQHTFNFEELKTSVLKYNLLFDKLLVMVSHEQ